MPIDLNLEDSLTSFCALLRTRFERNIQTTEDSVRYTYFAALLSQGIPPEAVILEYPHPALQDKKIDTWIPDVLPHGLAIEFKYNRSIPSGKSLPLPHHAGKLFNDLYRLALFPAPARRIFVHATTAGMAAYLARERNRLADFFNLPTGQSMAMGPGGLNALCQTFQRAAGAGVACDVIKRHRSELPNAHLVQAWEVVPHPLPPGDA